MSMDDICFEKALEDYLPIADCGELGEGSIVQGEVVRIGDTHVLVDVNFKSEGQIPVDEFRDAEGNIIVGVGERVDVYVVRKNEADGTIVLSRERAKRMKLFDDIEKIQEGDDVIKGRIVRRIKGGYTVDLGGVEAFLPGSHVDLRPVPDMDALVDQEYEFRILKINRRRSNVIVSRRVLLEEDRAKKRSELLHLEESQTVPAGQEIRVRVFVDWGWTAVTSRMSWKAQAPRNGAARRRIVKV